MLRNFITTLTRFRLSSALNIFGLSVAFASFIIMMMQVTYEQGYGKSDPRYKEFYRVETPSTFENGMWSCQIDGPTVQYISQSEPRVRSCHYGDGLSEVTIWGEDSTKAIESYTYEEYTNPANFFTFNMVQGTKEGLESNDVTIIPLSLAKTLYPKGAVGEILRMKGKYYRANREHTIIGVYADFPNNATLKNYPFIHSNRVDKAGQIFDASIVYIEAAETDTAQIIDNIYSYDVKNNTRYSPERVRLTPMGEAYYADDVHMYGDTQPGNRSTTTMLLTISILIIVIAAINFINFSTALAPMRIRGLNIRLVFGRTKAALRLMLVSEAVGLALAAYIVALFWVYCFNLTPWASLIKTSSTALQDNLEVVIFSALLAIVVGAVAGVYPALYCTRFSTAQVLKGSGMGSSSGQWLRSVLIGFQYVVSIGLIIVALFITLQNNFLRTFALGFNKDNVLQAQFNGSPNEMERFSQILRGNPTVKGVTYSHQMLGSGYGLSANLNVNGDTIQMQMLPVQTNFLRFFGIPIIQGRDFIDGELQDIHPEISGIFYDSSPNQAPSKIIVNKIAAQMYNIKVDSTYGGRFLCVGICENLNARALYNSYEPFALYLSRLATTVYVRVGGEENIEQVYKFMEKSYTQMGMDEEFSCSLMDEALQEQYIKEQNLSRLINLFSMVAIVLSLVGVFGLVVFETQYRRREIGLRKIYGSTVWQVLWRFNRKFLVITIICFLIALPTAWFGVNEWLSTFAFHTSIYWWIFALSLLIVGAITVLTVTAQSYHSATENPIKSIKTE
ncbi:MAG: FtsX-like permease family protein [Mucinivorans sp.]